jgi:hypothetical protein
MTITEKKEKISSIQSTNTALVILERIIKKAGLENVIRYEKGYLTAIEKTPFSTRNLAFFPSIQELNGKDSEIHEKVSQIDCSGYDEVYIVSTYKKPISKYYRTQIEERFNRLNFGYWNSEDLINRIDSLASDYWTHTDTFIKPYEESFLVAITDDFELKRLKIDDKYIKMLNIFIEPRLSILYNDDDDENLIFTKSFQRKKMITTGNFIVSGGAGTGKSTLQKQIAKEVIEKNLRAEKKTLPIIIKQADIINNNGEIKDAIDQQLLKNFQKYDLRKIFKDYEILLLIDSIDEFNKEKRQSIISDIESLQKDYEVRYIIATRDRSYLLDGVEIEENFERITLENFNLSQSKLFLEHFFQFDQNKSSKLLESLTSNKILDKLAVTPLTLSLISILFEEKQYEIPATITDIYDNFKMILLGRAHVKSSLEFLDINIKERLLSLYALEILQTEEKKPKTIEEFELFVEEFLKSKSSTYDVKTLPDVLKYFTKEIDILFIENNKYVKFKHSSFMEYFAAAEIFRYQRNLEDTLTQSFTDLNWQNTAIFYGGHSKDMKDFLQKITNKTTTYKSLSDLLVSNIGLGYLLQALYLTNEESRKASILTALELNAKIFDKINTLASERATFFENMKLHTIATLCTIQFLHNYSSFTLKGALMKAYEELKEEYNKCIAEKSDKARSIGYKLFNVAVTLHSDKINDQSKIEDLFDTENILSDPFFVMLFEIILRNVNPEYEKELTGKAKVKSRRIKYNSAIRHYVETPARELRNTRFDNIGQYKKVKLYTEGSTDADIIDKAFLVLNNNHDAYWDIRQSGNAKTAGANTLSKMLSSMPPPPEDEIIIGIFDNDSKGIREFESLSPANFDKQNGRIKKHKEHNIYAIKLPIPPGKEAYKRKKQEFMFFAIEHYFPIDFLEEHEMVKETGLPGVFEIKGKKTGFARTIKAVKDPKIFEDFKCLFQVIDKICGKTSDFTI